MKTLRNKYNFRFLSVLIIGILLSFTPASTVKKVIVSTETKILSKGKVITVSADVFYNHETGKMVTHYIKPLDYVLITNSVGEAKVYYPKSNEVYLKQSFAYETEKSLLYYFFANKLSDLGLKELGFTLSGSKYEDGMVVSTWNPSFSMSTSISKIELVHEKYLPIYLGYYDSKGKLVKKIYYYDYQSSSLVKFPMKVVEFNYLSDGDSIINRTSYSGIKTNEQAISSYFDYKIPANAKIIE